MNKKVFWIGLLFVLGLAVRIPGTFLWGTQDMEWWKAWGSYAANQSVTEIYGMKDSEILSMKGKNMSSVDIYEKSLRKIPYDSFNYFRKEYKVVQPPIYIYSLYLTTKIYKIFSHELKNNRLFNFFLNIEPVCSSLIIALVIGLVVSKIRNLDTGIIATLLFWLNPVVILNSPIQGFRDPLCALLAISSLVFIYHKNIYASFVFLALAILTKPQGILVAPVVMWVALMEHSPLLLAKAVFVGVVSVVVVFVPFIISQNSLSVILGVLSITTYSSYLSGESLNMWWPIQYFLNTYSCHLPWNGSLPLSQVRGLIGFNPALLGLAAFGGVTILNLAILLKGIAKCRELLFWSAGIQVYIYFMFSTGVLVNHYYIMIPMFTLAVFATRYGIVWYFVVTFVFFAQDFIFYGFGRDFNYGVDFLTSNRAGILTVFLSIMNFGCLAIALTKMASFSFSRRPSEVENTTL